MLKIKFCCLLTEIVKWVTLVAGINSRKKVSFCHACSPLKFSSDVLHHFRRTPVRTPSSSLSSNYSISCLSTSPPRLGEEMRPGSPDSSQDSEDRPHGQLSINIQRLRSFGGNFCPLSPDIPGCIGSTRRGSAYGPVLKMPRGSC